MRISSPFLILGAAALVIALLVLIRSTPEERLQPNAAPLVRTLGVKAEPYHFQVTSQGEVSPRSETELVPQVSGEVIELGPSLATGGFFEKDELLARIDPADYRVALEGARASVARASSEFKNARKERDRQRRLADRSVTSQAQIDAAETNFRVAEAVLRQARAELERAQRDLDRTELRAPYRGRVRDERVDLGQFVSRGTSIATLYAVDYAEVRLPLPDRELAYLDLPLVPRDPTGAAAEAAAAAGAASTAVPSRGPASVRLEAEFAGARHVWQAELVRTEAVLDPRSRMIHVVARVKDPYGLETPRSAPLAFGLFVEATIEGRRVDRAYVLPRDALRDDDRVYVIDDESRLHFRKVKILRTEREQVVVEAGLEDGDRICVSPLQAAIDGMAVRVHGEEESAPTVAPRTPEAAESEEAPLARRSEALP